jgi:hypothetical protein
VSKCGNSHNGFEIHPRPSGKPYAIDFDKAVHLYDEVLGVQRASLENSSVNGKQIFDVADLDTNPDLQRGAARLSLATGMDLTIAFDNACSE